MSCFPQLKSGSMSQYPVEVSHKFRTVLEETIDGRQIRWNDVDDQVIEWRCEYTELLLEEWHALRDFHAEVEGQLQLFTFLDPMDNLFRWSENLLNNVWLKDPYIAVSGGIGDPLGGTGGFQLGNSGVIEQSVVQEVLIPGNYTACFSAWVRGQGAAVIRQSGSQQEIHFSSHSSWTRLTASFEGTGSSSNSSFGIQLSPGAAIDLFGPQLDAQPAASSYKKTNGQGGVYANARFADDRLSAVAIRPDCFGCVVKVRAARGA